MALARAAGWYPGARLPSTLYAEHAPMIFADQDWRRFDGLTPDDAKYQRAYQRYIAAVAACKPWMASVVDWEVQRPLEEVLTWAVAIAPYVQHVQIIPKISGRVDEIPESINGIPVVLGASVPTKHGGTECWPEEFAGRPVHLLGGSPAEQLSWTAALDARAPGHTLVSADGNMCHNASGFGTYWTGQKWRNDGKRAITTQEALRRSLEAIPLMWRRAGWEIEVCQGATQWH